MKIKRKKISELGEVITGKTPSKNFSKPFGNKLQFFTPSDIQNQRYVDKTQRCLSEESIEKLNKYVLPKNTILVTCIGSDMGKVCITRSEGISNQQINAIIPNKENDYLFIYYLLKTKKNYLRNYASGGSTMPIINKNDFSNLEFNIPPLPTQINISSFLSSLDEKIELNQKMNETLEDIGKSLFKSWFIDFDPVRAKSEGRPTGLSKRISDLFPDSFDDSELGEIPRGWSISVINDIATKISDKYKKDEDWSKEKLIDLSRMPSNSIALNSFGKGDQLSTSVCKFQKYDFLFGSIRPYFYKAGICPFDGVSNTSVFILRANKIFDREFMYFYSSSMNTFEKSVQYSGGTKMPIIKWSDFKEFKFACPNKELREHFSSKIKPIVDKIILNIEEEEVLTKLRDLLLPKLISGEIKISEAESLIEEASI